MVLATGLAVFAQQSHQDVVYLKNGSIVRGRITEHIPGKQLTLETVDGIVSVYRIEDVAKVYKRTYPGQEPGIVVDCSGLKENKTVETKESAKGHVKPPTQSCSRNAFGFKKRFQGIVELGYARGVDADELNFRKLTIIGDYRLNPYFSFGIGSGCRYYLSTSVGRADLNNSGLLGSVWPVSPKAEAVMPFFADLRINSINKNVIPYLSLGIGYSLIVTKKNSIGADFFGEGGIDSLYAIKTDIYQGGFLLNPTLGVSCKIFGNCALMVSIGYEMQRMTLHRREEYTFWYKGMGGSWIGPFPDLLDKLIVVNSSSISFNTGISF